MSGKQVVERSTYGLREQRDQMFKVMSRLQETCRPGVPTESGSYERGFEEGYNALADILRDAFQSAFVYFDSCTDQEDEFLVNDTRNHVLRVMLESFEKIGPGDPK